MTEILDPYEAVFSILSAEELDSIAEYRFLMSGGFTRKEAFGMMGRESFELAFKSMKRVEEAISQMMSPSSKPKMRKKRVKKAKELDFDACAE